MASVVSNYARAFADVVLRAKLDVAKSNAELQQFGEMLEQVPQLRQVLDNPAVKHEQRVALIDALAGQYGFTKQLRNFIAVLIDHRRLLLLPEIAQQFRAELNQRLGIAEAQVTTARALSEGERSEIEKQVAALTGKTVQAGYQQDASLLGGAVIKVGSTVYDGSLRGQLERVKEQMAGS